MSPIAARRGRRCRAALAAALLALAWGAPARAHDLAVNRLTLVQRDDAHVALTFRVDYVSALHQVLMPERPFQDFVVLCAAMPPDQFAGRIAEAQALLSAQVRLHTLGGAALTLADWRWPPSAETQASLREAVMRALVAPDVHEHPPEVEITVDGLASRAIDGLRVDLPPALGAVLIIGYRPRQVWHELGAPPAEIRF